MKSSNDYKKIKINITTYSPNEKEKEALRNREKRQQVIQSMCDHACRKNQHKFTCNLCMNSNNAIPAENIMHKTGKIKKLNQTCPYCEIENMSGPGKKVDATDDGNTGGKNGRRFDDEYKWLTPSEVNQRENDYLKNNSSTERRQASKFAGSYNLETKVVETQTSKSQIDFSQGLNLLNEVLNVFQSNKTDKKPCCDCKTVYNKDTCANEFSQTSSLESNKVAIHNYCECTNVEYRDACVNTDGVPLMNSQKLNLSMSKIAKYSINEEKKLPDQPKFVILESRQPDMTSYVAVNLRKHKSSSIPQMKMEELKHSLKEKTKSKDAIEEVNRMFACVGKCDKESVDDKNRPMVRSGPRVLPLVKTNKNEPIPKETKDKFSEISPKNFCQHCQTSLQMSSGDSKDACRSCKCNKEGLTKCDKCVFMLSCHHYKHNPRPGVMICECCKRRNNGCRCSQEEELESTANF